MLIFKHYCEVRLNTVLNRKLSNKGLTRLGYSWHKIVINQGRILIEFGNSVALNPRFLSEVLRCRWFRFAIHKKEVIWYLHITCLSIVNCKTEIGRGHLFSQNLIQIHNIETIMLFLFWYWQILYKTVFLFF